MPRQQKYDGVVKSVKDLLDRIADTGLAKSHHAHVKLWFRGHAGIDWELHPGVYRSGFSIAGEDERLRKEQHMSQDFRVEAAPLLTGRETDAELYFLQQHYRMPTRLLDWTTSPLHALYFAVSADPSDSVSDGELFMMDAYGFAPSQKLNGFRGIATARNPDFGKALDVIFQWKGAKDFSNFIIPVRPHHFDRRMSLQRSCFTFHVPERQVLTKAENNTLRSFSVPQESKQQIKEELFLFGIDDFSVYGDLEGLSRRLKTAYRV